MKRVLAYLAAGFVLLFIIIQFIPYDRDRTNPPIIQEPQWDNPTTRTLAVRACFDCHSNETIWPAYTNIAPLSWLVQNHVTEGRAALNFSEWGTRPDEGIDEIVASIEDGSMPIPSYLPGHPQARLTAAEQAQLISGLRASMGAGEAETGQ